MVIPIRQRAFIGMLIDRLKTVPVVVLIVILRFRRAWDK